jgi:hypothetical protein
MSVMGLIDRNDYKTRVRILRIWAVVSPAVTSVAYFFFQNPVWMLTMGQLFGAIKFPLIAGGVIYLRYKHLDQRIKPSPKTDVLLWLCFAIMVGLAVYILNLRYFT